MIFKSQANYSSVSSISRLLSTDSLELARINDVSASDSFPTNKEVIIPVNCSCSGQYYQANTSHVIDDVDTYYSLATGVYQGLSSCNALMGENPYDANDLFGGLDLLVPLRCACPSRNQTADGIKYLLTYPVSEGDSFPDLSDRFNASYDDTASANGFSEQGEPTIYPSTTILIPLPREPSSSQTIIHHPIEITPFQPLHPFINNSIKRSHSKLRFSIGIAVASLLFLCALVAAGLWCDKKWMKRAVGKKKAILPKHILKDITDVNHGLKVFSCEELNAATQDFSSEYRIGGSVYRGVVRGNVVAVKEVIGDVSEEVNLLQKLNHFNLISLWGIGTREEHCYLVYEYMENGSLKDWLMDRSRSELLSWNQRVQIALDIANGLDYLHNSAEPPYVHTGINSSNVLLDSNLRAKIANFSMARSLEGSGFAIARTVEGTLGCMAPEYLEGGLVTPKIDVYASGVVMLELITGKDAVIEHEGRETLLSSVMISIVEGRNAQVELSNFLDSTTRDGCQVGLALAMAKLSVACLRQDPESRPSMGEVVSILLRVQMESKKSGVA
ncbi:lysM domain receptor-like kinase 4 [Cocos nucifera]|uniref:LysM domain receptor-like kinase 4 n=1 Tax=Cocos nucifera TaxID=13894 RepID=A0A8K0N118_COCNU|nr:lysM domain receptor-like kinase 4 [Cocos nucifera]